MTICINRFWLDAARDNAAERRLFESMVSPICVCSKPGQDETCAVTMIQVHIDSDKECDTISKKLSAMVEENKERLKKGDLRQ